MNPTLKSIEAEAAQWRARVDLGLTPAQEQELERWLEQPSHAAAFEAMERTWDRLEGLKFTEEGKALEAELDGLPPRRHARGAWVAGLLAAAAAVAIVGYVRWYQPMTYSESMATAVGQVRKMELPDGSVVELNTASALDVHYSFGFRRVTLVKGEALFAVAKDKDRPFVVTAEGVEVRAVGTAFGVRLRDKAVEVMVTEGKVRVDKPAVVPASNAPEQFLVAGERASIGREGQDATLPLAQAITVATVTPEDITRALAWREERLVFVSVPLATIVAEFNRYNDRKLVIADPELAERKFGGTFQANDPGTLVQLLTSSYDVVADEQAAQIILRRAK